MSTFTNSKQLEQVARGADVGTWDTPTNSNWGITDAALAGTATIPLAGANIVLAAAQFQAKEITFNSTLIANVTITFPTSFTGPYTVQNLCTGSSQFTITLITASTGQAICCPPIELFDMWNDGTNLKYRNFGRIGTYWDYAGSSVPAWVSGCTVAPYLNCDGTTFSATTFPALAMILGSTTLPDSKGRARATLNQGSARLTSSQGGVDGNTLGAAGGTQTTTLSSLNVPPVPVTDPGHVHGYTFDTSLAGGAFIVTGGTGPGTKFVNSAVTGISAGSTSPTAFSNINPTYISGLTLLRAG